MAAPLTIRPMTPADVALALDWAAAEGWNPGHADAACFTAVDPQGFLIGEVDGEPAATISVVNYDSGFAFLGFYIVRPDLRGRGFGYRLWQAGIAHAGGRVIGLDGVVAQQDNYRKSGFAFAYTNIRYGGVPSGVSAAGATVPLTDMPFAQLERDDATVFPAPRPAFLRAWHDAPGHVGRALMRDGRLAAWGVIRPCRNGHKIGPLVADNREDAETVFAALIAHVDGEVFLDVPQPNTQALALAEAHGLFPRVRDRAHVHRRDPPAGAGTRVRRDDVRARLAAAEPPPRLLVFRPRRREDIEHAAALRPRAHGVRHVAGRAPEVALLDGDFLVALVADGGALQAHPPLLLGVMVHRAFRVRPDRHHRQHGLLAGEDARRHAVGEFAQQAVVGLVEIVEFFFLAHRCLLPVIVRRRHHFLP